LIHQPFLPSFDQLRPFELNTALRAAIILAASMATQLISQAALTFSTTEQALYFEFGAVCEEVFFRVLILTFAFKFVPQADQLWYEAETKGASQEYYGLKWRVVGKMAPFILIQAVFFTALHQNYYNNPAMLISVALGGIILGIFYVWWRDPTANILAHFVLNIFAVQASNNPYWVLGIAALAIFAIFSNLSPNKKRP